ncbi:unnamed protein product [Sphagnum jensenii]|uniref:FAS1 domain-containing protein n=1 Tax=Sphagnum jensenii TaxID=128206 RepID=A0ABP0VGV4_9BRYO
MSARRVIQTFFFLAIFCIFLSAGQFSSAVAQGTPAAAPLAATAAPPPAAAAAPKPTLHDLVIGALRAAGRYNTIAAALDNPADSVLVRADITLFAPADSAFASQSTIQQNDPVAMASMINFHIVTQELPFSDLLRLTVGTKLPTAATGITVLVTDTVSTRYGVDNAIIEDPDLYTDSTIAVHGINAVLNTTYYNSGAAASVPIPRGTNYTVSSGPRSAPTTATTEAAPTGTPESAGADKNGTIPLVSMIGFAPGLRFQQANAATGQFCMVVSLLMFGPLLF